MSDGSLFDKAYPPDLREAEHELTRKRHEKLGSTDSRDWLGVGLSGGGIRSATFCLGVFQGLSKKPGFLRRVDFLSTVSGGGYFGAFLGRLFTRDFIRSPEDVEDVLLGRKEEGVLKYLRENGRYLSPNGSGDLLVAGAVLLRNWFSLQLVLAVFFLTIFLGFQLLRLAAHLPAPLAESFPSYGPLWLSPYLLAPVLVFFLCAFPIGWAYWMIEPTSKDIHDAADKRKRFRLARWDKSPIPPWAGLLTILAMALTGLFAPPYFAKSLPEFDWSLGIPGLWMFLAPSAAAVLFWWGLAGIVHKWRTRNEHHDEMDKAIFNNLALRHVLSTWLARALVVTFALLVIAVIDTLGQSLYAYLRLNPDTPLGTLLAGIFSSLFVFTSYARRVTVLFSKGQGGRPRLSIAILANIAAFLLATFLLVSYNAASHAIAWEGREPWPAPEKLRIPEKKGALTLEVQDPQGAAIPLELKVGAGAPPASAGGTGESGVSREPRNVWTTAIAFAVGLIISFCFGRTQPFINRSSHQALYAARLTRAYLGASNRKRFEEQISVTKVMADDDTDLADYWPPPPEKGTPLHLINVTINETVDGRSQIQQQDRKGTALAVGPCALSVGFDHHALVRFGHPANRDPLGAPVKIYPESKEVFRVFEYPESPEKQPIYRGEPMPLGDWVAISGAAFSTGTGFQTNPGLSFLAGFANVRIGRWWDSGIRTSLRRHISRTLGRRVEAVARYLFPMQVFLLSEFMARFHGTAWRSWYLSDGGHFENLGGYELIRRRLPHIVIIDAEQDGGYKLQGLSNLVRKARLDFGAEIEFFDEWQLDDEGLGDVRPYIGTLDQLRRGDWKIQPLEKGKGLRGTLVKEDPGGTSLVYAALARVTYRSPDSPESRLLYIKPTLTGTEPADVLEYHRAHPSFPHEPTGDQFFDEAQWESYRKLGQHIAGKLRPYFDLPYPRKQAPARPA